MSTIIQTWLGDFSFRAVKHNTTHTGFVKPNKKIGNLYDVEESYVFAQLLLVRTRTGNVKFQM